MTETLKINGTLRNARRIPRGEDLRAPCLSGEVSGDTRGRFRDGERITTSTIFEELGNGLFKTRFSAYKVESWADEKPVNDNDLPTSAELYAAHSVEDRLTFAARMSSASIDDCRLMDEAAQEIERLRKALAKHEVAA